ncbi:MAG: undecaprenyl-diphosphate phosphatase [Candidatus Acidiferrales bacterium]
MTIWRVIILAAVNGLTELLPVSSSAHVVVAEKLMGMDPSSPEMTLLLVMLHTGTMFAVILYFWKQWHDAFFRSAAAFRDFAWLLILATVVTGVLGEALIKLIEKVWHVEVEQLFSHLEFIAPALAVVGVLILIAGAFEKRGSHPETSDGVGLNAKQASLIGAVQALCLPFRGFSRSGATISAGMLAGVAKMRAEQFSFALAVMITPAADAREALRLLKFEQAGGSETIALALLPGILGAFCAFLAGLVALKWLSKWLEGGRWYLFGIYCLAAAVVVAYLHHAGF